MTKKHLIILILFAFYVTEARAETPRPLSTAVDSGTICRLAIEIAEVQNAIPGELLQAVALNESGKWNKKHESLVAWPWTVTVEGKGRYYDNFEDAEQAIQKFRKKGISNIDIGCLQINMAYHGKHFGSIGEMLDPINNVAYGATYLTYLRSRENSWTRAVKFYHSANRIYHEPYRKKVIKTWQGLRRAKIQKTNEARKGKTTSFAHSPPANGKLQPRRRPAPG